MSYYPANTLELLLVKVSFSTSSCLVVLPPDFPFPLATDDHQISHLAFGFCAAAISQIPLGVTIHPVNRDTTLTPSTPVSLSQFNSHDVTMYTLTKLILYLFICYFPR